MPLTHFTRLRTAVQKGIQRTIIGQEGRLQDAIEVLIVQEKSGFHSYRLFRTLGFSTVTNPKVLLRPGTIFSASSDLLLINQRRNLSVVGALSCTFAVPSVSGLSFQVCGYHINRVLSEPSQILVSSKLLCKQMAACGSKVLLGECRLDYKSSSLGHPALSRNDAGIIYKNRGSDSCRKASMSLKSPEQRGNSPIDGYFMYNFAKRWANFSPYMGSLFGYFHSSSTCFSAGTAPDLSFDNSAREEQLSISGESSEQKISHGKTLKLISGSCYLPHPDKEETGGEDAHFICADEQAVGVADGVGGWADLGIDSGQYSRELMCNSVTAIREEPKGLIDPARVLEKAYSSTKAKGSSTACIIALTEQGLHAINLGDSGFMVVRDGCTIFRSPVQQHDFNFTYQLESGNNGDLPSCGQVFTIPVAPGDVIISGTDGLFDNLYNNEITAVVVHAIRAGLGPQVTAQKIAALARQRAQDKDRQTPFSTAAQDAGFRYYGGKLDDITVVVSFITGSTEEKQSS